MADHPVPTSAHPGVYAVEHAVERRLLRFLQRPLLAVGPEWFPDLSEFNGAVDWGALGAAHAAGSISGVAIRAGFGTVRADRQFTANQAGARSHGIPAIYYWFNYPTYNTPQAEAAKFNSVVGRLQPGEAQCGDFEDDAPASIFPRGQAGADWAKAFLTALEAPQNASWWYTYPFLLSVIPFQQLYGTWPFWLADYSATTDSAFSVPIARQFTDCGSTPGVSGCCDQSRVLKQPLEQWLTGGLEVLDPNDPIVVEIRSSLGTIFESVALQPDPGWHAGPSPGNPGGPGYPGPAGSWEWSWRAWYVASHPGLNLPGGSQHGPSPDMPGGPTGPAYSWQWRYVSEAPAAPTVDVNALATALATHPLTATLSDAERDAVATHVLQHLSKDTAAG